MKPIGLPSKIVETIKNDIGPIEWVNLEGRKENNSLKNMILMQ